MPQYFHWFSTDGYGNLSSGRYAQLLSTIVNGGKLAGSVRRSDTDLYEASERDPFGFSNPYRMRMMSLFGVKYVLETKKGILKDTQSTEVRFPEKIFSLVWEDDTWRIWQYKPALPRVMFVRSYIVRNDAQQIIDALYDPSLNLATTVVLEHEPNVRSLSRADISVSTASAVITSYSANTVTISTSSQVDGFAVLSDTYYPGWTAAVDGRPAEVYRADFTIRAVAVPYGTHTVIFTYRPVTFIIGIVLTLVGILLTVSACGAVSGKTK
ncbi:MAG: YfhO family protein [Candidatus Gottesmanbacteria bacterium]|nr:YfhO family protein [Candidatus Gottesmanbacteria bacterium]